MRLIDPPNIFRGAPNDINVSAMKYKINRSFSYDKLAIEVASIVENELGINPLISTGSRKRERVLSRQVFTVMLMQISKGYQPLIETYIEKDRCTIIHSVKAVKNLYDTDKKFRDTYTRIYNKIRLIN